MTVAVGARAGASAPEAAAGSERGALVENVDDAPSVRR